MQAAAQRKSDGFEYDSAFRLLTSPLLKLPVFRAMVARELQNQTPVAVLWATSHQEAEIKVTAWNWSGRPVWLAKNTLERGQSRPLRVADVVGSYLMEQLPDVGGQTQIGPLLDVSQPLKTRSERLKIIAARVRNGRIWVDDLAFEPMEY